MLGFIYLDPMLHRLPHISRCTAAIILVMVLLSPLIGVCHDDETCAMTEGTSVAMPHGPADTPCCPDSEHHNPNHDSCSDCPCHAPIPPTIISMSFTRFESPITRSETSRLLPEVYLSLFDPPDVAA